jgi:hypothetical protein
MVEEAEIGKEYNMNMRKLSFYEYHAFKKDYYRKIKESNKKAAAGA